MLLSRLQWFSQLIIHRRALANPNARELNNLSTIRWEGNGGPF